MHCKHILTTISIALAGIALAGCSATQNSNPNKMTQEDAKQSAHINKKHVNKTAESISNTLPNQILHGKAKLTKRQAKFTRPMKYNSRRVFKMMPLDKYGRAQGSHIQLSESQTPTAKRSAYLTVKPSGWHNYKFTTNKGSKSNYTTWLYNRGHLVGYQFCGLNNEPKNLITETTYLNQGGLTGMNDNNPKAMLFYENRLRNWLRSHPTDKLDYSVMPMYSGRELVARDVQLKFVGINKRGRQIKISGMGPLVKHQGNMQTVKLANVSPQAKIDYKTGYAQVFNSNGSPIGQAKRYWHQNKGRYEKYGRHMYREGKRGFKKGFEYFKRQFDK